MKFGGRDFARILRAVRQPEQYKAMANMFRLAPEAPRLLLMYLSGRGRYPRQVRIRTPLGYISPTLYSHHDLLTVNEVFFRLDYEAGPETRVVVDLGSNIGLSALYFLTRHESVRCYLAEPVPINIERLKSNLREYESRWTLHECAVDAENGIVAFGTERTGRYGGIGKDTGNVMQLPCRSVNDLLLEVLQREGSIDMLKIDTEGAETRTVAAINAANLSHIKTICMEAARGGDTLHLDGFEKTSFNALHRFTRVR